MPLSSSRYTYGPVPDIRPTETSSPDTSLPLPSQKATIRLLTIKPGQDNDEMSCSFSLHNLLDGRQYEAISYAWGSSERTRSVTCEGKRLAVTESCYIALKYIRLLDQERTIWVDAVCIDQDNLDKRSEQAQLMRYVYRAAKRVLIWLGEERDGDRDAFKIADEVYNKLVIASRESGGHIPSYHAYLMFRTMYLDTGILSAEYATPFFILGARPWFRRLRTIQESINAREAIAICGRQTIDFYKIEASNWAFTNILQAIFSYLDTMPQKLEAVIGNHNIDQLYDQKLKSSLEPSERFRVNGLFGQKLTSSPKTLSKFMMNMGHDYSDPRDRVYAILGLIPFREVPKMLIPDYTLDFRDVYSRLARWAIVENQDFSFLSFIREDRKVDESWPSWVPDWSYVADSAEQEGFYVERTFGTTLALPPKVIVDGKVLEISGKQVDVISTLSYTKLGPDSKRSRAYDLYLGQIIRTEPRQ